MEGHFVDSATAGRTWQGELCQFFTRDEVARFCLQNLKFSGDVLSWRVLEPSAGLGAFILPLIPVLVRELRKSQSSPNILRSSIRAYEVDRSVAASLQAKCASVLAAEGLEASAAARLAKHWVRCEDFLESRIQSRFTHIIGNPPYIRWDAIPTSLRNIYRKRFISFKQRADLYVAFIEKSLGLLQAGGQLGFLCPGTWTRNVYGGSIREALTSNGHLASIIDLSDVDSFETPADAYPHFFVFREGRSGTTRITRIKSIEAAKKTVPTASRRFVPSSSPLVLTLKDDVASALAFARERFPKLEDSGCAVRVGSATGCNGTFLVDAQNDCVEESRLLPFVNARSIRNGLVAWTGTKIVNVFDLNGKPVSLARFPRLRDYLHSNEQALKARAKASKSPIWWRSIDTLHPDWYLAPKLLIVDISTVPVIGYDKTGYCAGSGVYQIKSNEWPLRDLWVLLSAGILGLFVVGMSAGAKSGFHRFQKSQIANIPLPPWDSLDANWITGFRKAYAAGKLKKVLEAVSSLYECPAEVLASYVSRDWQTFLANPKAEGGNS